MAYIEQRRNGWLVVWRDASHGNKKTSRLVSWSEGESDPVDSDDFAVTRDEALRKAELLRDKKRQLERAYRKPLERVIRQNAQDYPDWHPQADLFIGDGEESLAFESIVLGSFVDGVPESLIFGIGVAAGSPVSVSFLAAVIVSNIPQALAPSADLAKKGWSRARLALLWTSVLMACAVASGVGYLIGAAGAGTGDRMAALAKLEGR